MRTSYFLLVILFILVIANESAFTQTENNPEIMFNLSKEHFVNGEYKEAITIYDDILESLQITFQL